LRVRRPLVRRFVRRKPPKPHYLPYRPRRGRHRWRFSRRPPSRHRRFARHWPPRSSGAWFRWIRAA